MKIKGLSEEDLYKKALEKWGHVAQTDQAIEELAELIVALRHLYRGKSTRGEVAQEVADVEIMMGQLRLVLGPDLVEASKERKLERLAERIGLGEEKKS